MHRHTIPLGPFFVCLLTLVYAVGLTLSPTTPASAATSVVGTGTPHSCTEAALRSALGNGGTVTFNCGAAHTTITVTDDLVVAKTSQIDGGGTQQGGLITLSGGGTTRVLQTSAGAALTIRNLTISGGKEPGSDGRGGAVRACWRCPLTLINSVFRNNDGTAGNQEGGGGAIFVHESTLVVTNSLFTDNHGVNGGAINNLLSQLQVNGTTFSDNTANGYGGAIYTDGASWPTDDAIGGQITISGSTFRNNRGAGQGGGAFLFTYPPDTVTIADSAFIGNTVITDARGDALGGGLRQGNGDLTLRTTTFSANVAQGQGGAFWKGEKGQVTATNVTFANNSAVADATTGKGGLGGAIAGGGNLTCINCTIAGNHAGFVGGAIFGGSAAGSDTITLQNTIVANNTAFNDGNNWNKNQNCAAQLADGGNNLQYPARNPSADSTQYPDPNCTAVIAIAEPKLGQLADNGGPNQTLALATDSPAVDNGTNCPATDQRGIARPQGKACDIGAYELVNGLTIVPGVVFAGTSAFTLTVLGSNFSANSTITWDATPLATTYVSNAQLTARISADAIARAGSVQIGVSGSALPAQALRISDRRAQILLPLVVQR